MAPSIKIILWYNIDERWIYFETENFVGMGEKCDKLCYI